MPALRALCCTASSSISSLFFQVADPKIIFSVCVCAAARRFLPRWGFCAAFCASQLHSGRESSVGAAAGRPFPTWGPTPAPLRRAICFQGFRGRFSVPDGHYAKSFCRLSADCKCGSRASCFRGCTVPFSIYDVFEDSSLIFSGFSLSVLLDGSWLRSLGDFTARCTLAARQDFTAGCTTGFFSVLSLSF